MNEFLKKHVGTSLLNPPSSPERRDELGPYESYEYDINGKTWRYSDSDFVLAGLGWVSITGTGKCRVRITVPKGTNVDLRPSLLPYEHYTSSAVFSGGRIIKKSKKPLTKSGEKGSTYGWRA
jgi:hypothetical protein